MAAAGRREPDRLMCDVLVALPAATGGATLFAKNSDRPPAERQVLEWQPPRRDGRRLQVTHIDVEGAAEPTLGCVVSRPAWGWGAEHGVNEAGVAAGNTTVYTTLDPRGGPVGLTGMDLVRLGLERGGTAVDAVAVIVDLIDHYGQGGSGHDPALTPHGRPYWNSFLVADPTAAYVIDTSGREVAVEPVAATRAISNRTSIAGFDERHRHPRQPVERLVDPRWRASQRVLAQQPVTVESLQAHLRSHDTCGDPGWSVCMHVDGVEVTTASLVAALRPDGRSEVWTVQGHPCCHDYVHATVADLAR